MGGGTAKEGKPVLLDAVTDTAAFSEKWKLDADTTRRLLSAQKMLGGSDNIRGIVDVDDFANDYGISEEGRKALHKAYEAELEKDLPPAPPPPPDLTDELLVKSRMAQGAKTRSAQGVASTFLAGKTKVGG